MKAIRTPCITYFAKQPLMPPDNYKLLGKAMSWQEDGRPAYRGSHWEGCSCAECLNVYERHNVDNWCACVRCQAHNLVNNNAFQMEQNRVVPNVATVNFCERCESMGKSSAMGTVQYIFEPSQGWTSIECCPGCFAEFMVWRNSKVFGDREKAYKLPYTEATEDEGGEIITKSNIRKLLLALESGDDNE